MTRKRVVRGPSPCKTPRRLRGPRKRKGDPETISPENERVLAFDSSSKACGWSIFEAGNLVAHGRFLQDGEGHGERLMRFRLWILEMLRDWQPTLVLYEAPYQGRMRNTYGVLTRYVGVIEAAFFEHFGKELGKTEAVAAHAVKRAIGAQKGKNHEANKKIVVLLINRTFGLSLKFKANDIKKKVSQDDDADAIALNWAWHLMNRPLPEPDRPEAV